MSLNNSSRTVSKIWWTLLIALCLMLEGVALYYQYALDYLPCVLCIHVRMIVAAVLMIAVIGWLVAGSKPASVSTLVINTGLWIWMIERSYQLLGTERGWIMGECAMESGLPSWLALERWFPWIFEIHEPCGYTPYMLFNISMAEVLIVMSAVLSLVSIGMVIWVARSR
ncbi:MAG: disulfide bond formation protein B [bacterium]